VNVEARKRHQYAPGIGRHRAEKLKISKGLNALQPIEAFKISPLNINCRTQQLRSHARHLPCRNASSTELNCAAFSICGK
jgi:hypothetical protein